MTQSSTILLSIASALPQTCWTTSELLAAAADKFSDGLHSMVLKFGVEKRYSLLPNYAEILFKDATPAPRERGTEMAARAARRCVETSDYSYENIGLVIGVTSTPSRIVPGFVSDLFSEMPELPRRAANLSLQGQGCSPLLKAIEAASWFLALTPTKQALVVCMESPTPMSKPLTERRYLSFAETKSTESRQATVDVLHALLFADGAVALLLGAEGDGPRFGHVTHLTNDLGSDAELGHIVGAGSDNPVISGRPEYRLGPDIADRGIFYSKQVVDDLLQQPNCPLQRAGEADISLVHTGSKKILAGIENAFGLHNEKMRFSYDVLSNYGNLIGSSLGMMLVDALPTAKGNVLMITFGLSFSASAGILTMPA